MSFAASEMPASNNVSLMSASQGASLQSAMAAMLAGSVQPLDDMLSRGSPGSQRPSHRRRRYHQRRDLNFVIQNESFGHLPTVLDAIRTEYLRLMEHDPHGRLSPPHFLL